jgi:FkbM family methyltransferase
MGLSPIYGGWEEDAQALIVKHVHPGDVVYDIGANYGIHALLFARLVKNGGHVYAFEPVVEILDALQDNLKLNNFSNVSCLNVAVSDSPGSTSFVTGHHVGAGHLSAVGDGQGNQIMVKTTTLDQAVFADECRPPNFIKMDIEGAEGKALAGSMRVLREFRPVLLVDLHNPEQDLAVGRILSSCNYEAFHTEDGSKVKDLSHGWPDPNGLWGQFIAYPKN